MPQFRVTALERFVVKTVYVVTAANARQAEQLCKEGKASYDQQTIEEGDEEWIKTVSVEKA